MSQAKRVGGGAVGRVATVEEIRADVPALSREHGGRPVAYFDGPGGTQVPRRVVEAMGDYLTRHNANTHWAFPTSEETDELIAAARDAIADLLGSGPGEVVFGANMTTLTYHLGRALAPRYGPGDELVVTELDHHANSDPWRRLARERGMTVRTVRMIPETGQLDLEELERSINERTRLLAIGAASNVLGTVTDVAWAAGLARTVGALVFVDAVHYTPHERVDVKALGCDFLACSAYKFHGPHLGVLYGRQELLRELDAPKLSPAPDDAPERMETGTQNHEGIVGAGAAVEWLAGLALDKDGHERGARLDLVMAELHSRGMAIARSMWERLSSVGGVRLYGPDFSKRRTPTVSFQVEGMPAREVSRRLAADAIFCSHGDFYATTVVERLGLSAEGLVRAGAACYTTDDEVDRLVAGVSRAVRHASG